jgi:pyridoxal phosphate enzyme (YggS family)
MNDIAGNIAAIHETIAKTCTEFDCDTARVKLIAVSKKQDESRIEAALAAGQRVFGENRVQEAQERWGPRREKYDDLTLHLIGPLQTNKVKDAVALFDVIHTLDREKLARKLADEMAEQGRDLPCFIQVNTGLEEQKSGIAPEALPDFIEYCYGECGLDVVGLMCIPPLDDPPALHFALLKKLAEENGLSELSMGMSGDYEAAIPLGATYIRVGTGVFGARDY